MSDLGARMADFNARMADLSAQMADLMNQMTHFTCQIPHEYGDSGAPQQYERDTLTWACFFRSSSGSWRETT